ncbi:MAG TPA: SUMF1/EgtB/PvdO family nonheme iron enzyme [Spirochaetota bacterium]|nr:SUMF1/EgtB/PvdO family nonheme iron enzyme [Spirochaetota bacterium]HPI88830.1 SUMF1/EgtB/PvdO family nonheme iron enzyme [Spirochaetota bacterium]HPR47682.1 SUMF1/EgtB/PvdO family nonheme iron enzyme [Spirochaetota bacterium]
MGFINRQTGLALLLAVIIAGGHAAAEYLIIGKVEAKRKRNRITVLFDEKPRLQSYLIVRNGTALGSVDVLSVMPLKKDGSSARAECVYTLNEGITDDYLKAGDEIAFVAGSPRFIRDFPAEQTGENIVYKKIIVSQRDGREMVLIPEGKFYFGSNQGDRDEYPQQVVFLNDFYIDRYEVSNRDYYRYIIATRAPAPRSWDTGVFREESGSLPVLVTYKEALSYARWADKALPLEEQWEKAARGMFAQGDEGAVPRLYPWEGEYNPEKLNAAELWSSEETGKSIKIRYTVNSKTLLPVDSFSDGASPYGVFNMSGNAMEWTSSWYRPYKGNSKINGRYGTQYKVLRGGDYCSNWYKVRVTNREIGGAPNLYQDFVAGFRCVREARVTDREEQP